MIRNITTVEGMGTKGSYTLNRQRQKGLNACQNQWEKKRGRFDKGVAFEVGLSLFRVPATRS